MFVLTASGSFSNHLYHSKFAHILHKNEFVPINIEPKASFFKMFDCKVVIQSVGELKKKTCEGYFPGSGDGSVTQLEINFRIVFFISLDSSCNHF